MERRKALVLYGSETGNSQDVAEELGRMTERLHFASHVAHLDAVDPVSWFEILLGNRTTIINRTRW